MLELFRQMVRLPLIALAYSIEMFAKTIRGVQAIGDEGLDEMIARESRNGGSLFDPAARRASTLEPRSPVHRPGLPPGGAGGPASEGSIPGRASVTGGAAPEDKEKRVMDKGLNDDMLKLVRYKILFVRREYEHAFPEREDLVSDNMDGTAFSAWKTAEFIQELARKETRVPDKWASKSYPKQDSEFVEKRNGQWYLKGLPDEDKKYLRVYYEVLDRYPREKFKYEEQQIRVLEEIRDNVSRKTPESSTP